MKLIDKMKKILDVPEDDYYEELEQQDDYVTYNPGDEDASEKSSGRAKRSAEESDDQSKVVNIHTTAKLKVVLAKPERYEDARSIADHLNSKRTVVLNLEAASKDVARRLVDFLSGVAYANHGELKKVANSTFIITPYNVDVMGDLIDELENTGVYF